MTSKRYQEMSWTMIRYLLKKVKDLADWESGVVNRQIDNISKGICEHTPAQVYSLIATHDMMDMYNLGAKYGYVFYV